MSSAPPPSSARAAPASAEDPPFHFVHRRLVEFADTDLAGLVHFANFFRYVEAAEHAFFRSLGHAPHTAAGSSQHGWPRLETSARFLRPARFGDELDIGLRIQEMRTTSLVYRFAVLHAATRATLADGTFAIVHVAIDTTAATVHKTPIPPALREKLAALLASS